MVIKLKIIDFFLRWYRKIKFDIPRVDHWLLILEYCKGVQNEKNSPNFRIRDIRNIRRSINKFIRGREWLIKKS